MTIDNVVASQTLSGSIQTLQLEPVVANIDSATSQLWLPRETCDLFQVAFGLEYDDETDLYLVNETVHDQLKSNDPFVTFTIGDGNGFSTNLEMHYNAFDLNASIPIYNTSTPYFPLRRAANSTQYALGRAFLQEAYMIVDWERLNFTIGSTIAQSKTTDIVPILSSSDDSSDNSKPTPTEAASSSHKKSNTGTIAGAVVAVVVILALVAGIFYIVRRRRRNSRKSRESVPQQDPTDTDHGNVEYFPPEKSPSATGKSGSDVRISEMNRAGAMSPSAFSEMDSGQYVHDRKLSELGGSDIHELEDVVRNRELMSTPIFELEGDRIGSELDVNNSSPVDGRDYFGPVIVSDELPDVTPTEEGTARTARTAESEVRSPGISPLKEEGTQRTVAVSPLSENGTRKEQNP